jgi:hypothetical protein
LLCILYRGRGSLPRNRPEIYEQCSSLFLRHWDAYRRIHQDLRARDLVEPALRHLAYWIFTRPRAGTAVTERELVARTSVFLLERGFEQRAEADAAAAEFIQFCRGRAWVFTEAGVNSRGEALYAFTHRTFLEYFAAAHLAAVSDTPQRLTRRLAPRVARQQWDVVAELAVQIKDRTADRGAERIYTALLHDADGSEDERENTRAFLARCCAFAAPPPRILRELTQQAVTYAIRPNPHGSGRLAPLGWLLHSHLDGSHIIKDELTAAVDEQLKADDQDTRRQALALVVFAADVIWMVAGHEKRIGSSWDDFGTDNRVRYAQQMAEHAPDHPGFAVESFLQQAVSLRQVLDWHGPGVRPLVSSAKQISYRLGPNNEIAYLALPIAATFMGLPTGYHYRHPWRAWLLEQLHDFGDTLESLGDPPWSDSEDHDYRKYFAGVTDRIGLGPLTGTALAAAGVLLLTCAERDKHPDFIDLFSRVDHLEPFLPYLQARRDRSGSLPPLNVGHGHTRLFQDWARHQVDFTLPNRGDLEREAALPSSENNAR